MREAIRAIPDGTYRFDDVMDDDGLGTFDIPIKVAHRGRQAIGSAVDFTGTAPQVPGNINVTLQRHPCARSATR